MGEVCEKCNGYGVVDIRHHFEDSDFPGIVHMAVTACSCQGGPMSAQDFNAALAAMGVAGVVTPRPSADDVPLTPVDVRYDNGRPEHFWPFVCVVLLIPVVIAIAIAVFHV